MSAARTLPLRWVDAFSDVAYGGNPCAVVLDADGLSDAQMQTVAREMNLSETAFVLASDVADVRARYFTPAEEIPFAGHPTVATLFALAQEGRVAAPGRVRLQLEAGVVDVDLEKTADAGVRVSMSQMRPEFGRPLPDTVLAPFGLVAADLIEGARPMTVSTGTPQLMIPLRQFASLRRARIGAEDLAALREAHGFFSVHLFVVGGLTDAGGTFARHFALGRGVFEDPFTGSATGCMAAYLWRHGLVDAPRFVAQQGHWMGRPGEARVEVVGTPRAIDTVRVAGRAALVLAGDLVVPEADA